jgi:hypothetical protein
MGNGKLRKKLFLQSAMEYLMSYGWAILIISIVTAALLTLGVFNSSTGPRAAAGSCYVSRPNGPGTTQFITLKGLCNGQMPQYVAQFNGDGTVKTKYVVPAGSSATLVVWAYFSSLYTNEGLVATTTGSGGSAQAMYGPLSFMIDGSGCNLQTGVATNTGWYAPDTTNCLKTNTWYMLVATMDSVSDNLNIYINGVFNFTYSFSGTTNPSVYLNMSCDPWGSCSHMSGQLANIQLYNASLSAGDVSAMYSAGIGGAPLALQSLVGWWPLNGNAKDYGGSGYDGTSNTVSFTAKWTK